MAQKSGFRFAAIPLVLLASAIVLTQGRPWTEMRIAGAVIMVPALLLWGIAHIQLGDAFSVRAKAQRLVRTGLYARFRNPIYVFGGIGIAGYLLVIERPIWLLAFVVLIPLQLVRSRNEARVLEEKFGDEYREYVRHTWI